MSSAKQKPLVVSVDEAEAALRLLADAFLSSARTTQQTSPKEPKNKGVDFEAQYKALVERIPAVVFVAPLEAGKGNAYVSPQIETILGFTQDEWLGDPLRWYQQVHPDDKHRWSVEAASLFASGEPLSSNFRVISRDGRVVWFQCDARMVLDDDGSPSFIHGIGFDVTELKETELSLQQARQELEARVMERTRELAQINAQLTAEIEQHKRTERELIAAREAAEQAARIKAEFLANMSHEIRTPMNGVLGLTNLVLATDLSPEQREYLGTAYDSAESLLKIINQVLDFSKLEAGNAQLNSVHFHLADSMAALIRELEYLAEEKHLQLTQRLSPGLPEFLLGDLGRLRQVLTNLIGNAIKFTHTGGVTLEVAPAQLNEQLPTSEIILRFAVIDTGIGIPPEKISLVFEPFMQADGSVTREYGGTGLGLALSKELVQVLGGHLSVSSETGVGSTFSFTARFKIATVRGREPKSHSAANPERPLRILVAEDNLVNQKVVTRVLQKAGHTVTLAGNGREAVDACMKSVFDVVLMDVQMPLMDGLSATQAIRALEGDNATSRLPIIALTAHALDADRTRCLQAGMDGYLSKPFKPNDLLSLIENMANT